MRAAGSAQSINGMDPLVLNDLVGADPAAKGFPISGDRTTLVTPFYASIDRANAAGRTELQQVIEATHAAKAEAGRAQRERAAHTP